jgi:hypothetical protein
MEQVWIHYMSPRGAGIGKTVRTADECESALKRLWRRKVEARVTMGAETVGGVDPAGGDDGRGMWWFESDIFGAK